MVKLAIRDDDANFFTQVKDLEFVYKDFGGFPISFAVVPHVMDVSTKGACSDTKGNTTRRDIDKNEELCQWFKEKYSRRECDILLHGITHQYKFEMNKRIPEMIYSGMDGETQITRKIGNAKHYLENVLKCKISIFVAPSNIISKKCLNAVIANQMHFSGIIPITYQRKLTVRNILSYCKRWLFRLVTGFAYPGILKYSDHLEINACALRSFSYLEKLYDYCDKSNLPMAINVHYWHLRDNPEYLEMLRSFVMDYAIPKGAKPSRLSDILR